MTDTPFIEALKSVLTDEEFATELRAIIKDAVATEFNRPENQELLKKFFKSDGC